MHGVRAFLLHVSDWLEVGAEWSCRAAVVVMTGLVLTQVVLRYVFAAPLVWVEEASIFLMIWMAFVGAGIAIRRGAHVAMTLFVDRFPYWLRWTAVTVSSAGMIVFLLIVAWQGAFLAVFVADQPSPALRISMMWPYFVLPVGAVFMITQIFATLLEQAQGSPLSGESRS